MNVPPLKVRLYGDPCLRKKSEAVPEVGAGERMLVKAMLEAMYEHKGIGLAAPQVGINKQIFVADIGDGPFAVFNPKILRKSGHDKIEEGCLCLPGVAVNVSRAKTILVKYVNEDNQPVERELTELMARVFQHETDHLFGKMIIDYAGLRAKGRIEKYMKDIVQQKSPVTSCPSSIKTI